MNAPQAGGGLMSRGGLHFLLLGCAREPDQAETRALARAIGLTWGWPLGPVGGVLGLAEDASRVLFDRCFPGAITLLARVHFLGTPASSDPRLDEFADLLELLMAHRKDRTAQGEWVARAVAAGCMGAITCGRSGPRESGQPVRAAQRAFSHPGRAKHPQPALEAVLLSPALPAGRNQPVQGAQLRRVQRLCRLLRRQRRPVACPAQCGLATAFAAA